MPFRAHKILLRCLLGAVAFSAPYAQAIVVTRGGVTYYDVFSGSALPEVPDEFFSFARDAVSRSGFIKVDDEQQPVNEQDPEPGDDDFPGVHTSTPGETVGMNANIGGGLTLPPLENPARAMTDRFSNHVRATTARSLEFSHPFNDGESLDNNNSLDDYWVRNERRAQASSRWGDTWFAEKSEHATADFVLQGTISLNSLCPPGDFCGVIFPPGTDSVRTRDFGFDLWATMVVFDLSTLVSCDEVSDECDGEEDAPLPLDSITVRAGQGSASHGADYAILEGGGTIDIDITDTLEFEVIEGHEYYTVSFLSVGSRDGADLDFFNSFTLTRVNVSPGTLFSSALGGADITTQFTTPVPLPGALWLMLGGLGSLAARRGRTPQDACAADRLRSGAARPRRPDSPP